MLFKELNLIEPILKALHNEGYQQPTPIQEKAIPIILEGKDLLGCAQTGTGKTAAFCIPILQLLHQQNKYEHGRKRRIKALILTPTRELAIQINDSLSAYGKFAGIRKTVVYGGVSQHQQTRVLKEGVDILVATPGRLLDLVNQGYVQLNALDLFVLDEADRMLDMGFSPDVNRIIKLIPEKRQSLFFSATMPETIANLAAKILTDPVKIIVTPDSSTAETISQSVYFVDFKEKKSLLVHVLQDNTIDSALVFTRTKFGADKVTKFLNNANIKAEAIHGDKSQNARQRALKNFKSQKTRVLVATDIASRGIDVDNLGYVINFEIPDSPETYVHRIGRTGRAGASGTAISFCDKDENRYLRNIQKLISLQIPVVADHPYTAANVPATEEQQRPAKQKRNKNNNSARFGKGASPSGNGNNKRKKWYGRPKRKSAQKAV